jgi:hypothetical protein
MDVSGAVASIVTVRASDAAEVLPASSVAFASYACEPFETLLKVRLHSPELFAGAFSPRDAAAFPHFTLRL